MKSLITFSLIFTALACFAAVDSTLPPPGTIRVAAAQPKNRSIDWRLHDPVGVLQRVEQSLGELVLLLNLAAEQHSDVVAFPEDTLGLGLWEAGNQELLAAVLPKAVSMMLDRLGSAAAQHRIYLVCCNDTLNDDGSVRNTAFFIGRDGKEIGRYDKVNMPIHELHKKRGTSFPVFHTPDLGDVGMLICYDMVFPEAPRCLALAGADIIFHPTLGGAAIGDEDISRAAFRTRAVDNFVYLVVAQRGKGSMILSPQGKILAEASGPESLAIADINPFSGREGGDSMNFQQDMRARLFRERSPAAFGLLVDTNPPVLAKVPARLTEQEAARIASQALTKGEEEFAAADRLVRLGKTNEAIRAFERLQREYPGAWIERVAAQRLAKLRP